ncbi:MAG: winged helix DNA-binding protein [Sphingomonadales bacterium]|nr:winged helix DNA-binding protein [Sphingomonadales bacterium]MDE2570708.1 winged helix DNA-binding protein [Sphingomonadales bacterium]
MIRIASNRYAQLVSSDQIEGGGGKPRENDDAILCLAREIYSERRRRERMFPEDLFGEPSWDVLLDLFIAGREQRRVPTTSACIGSHVPPTTALRWLRILEQRGLIERENDRRDGRRTFVRLSPYGMNLLERFLSTTRAMTAECKEGGGRD